MSTESKSNKSPNYIQITEDFSIDGGLNEEALTYIKENNKSVLYLCPDSAADQGYVYILFLHIMLIHSLILSSLYFTVYIYITYSSPRGGFTSITKLFPTNTSLHEVFDPNALATITTEEEKIKIILISYRKMELFIKNAVKPISIICKSNARASAVYTAYNVSRLILSYHIT